MQDFLQLPDAAAAHGQFDFLAPGRTQVLQERDLNNGEPPYPYLDVQELEVLTKRGKQKVAM